MSRDTRGRDDKHDSLQRGRPTARSHFVKKLHMSAVRYTYVLSQTKYIDQLKEKNVHKCAHGFQMWDGAKGLRVLNQNSVPLP